MGREIISTLKVKTEKCRVGKAPPTCWQRHRLHGSHRLWLWLPHAAVRWIPELHSRPAQSVSLSVGLGSLNFFKSCIGDSHPGSLGTSAWALEENFSLAFPSGGL